MTDSKERVKIICAGVWVAAQVHPRMGLHIRIYMYEQDGVGWAKVREVL
jgi:hypothetical protein